MGCSGSSIVVGETNKKPIKENYIINKTEGILKKNSQFKDCLITNYYELDEKLIEFIPTRITYNNKDSWRKHESLYQLSFFNSFTRINKTTMYVNGVNDILKVEEKGGNYLIFHDNIAVNPEKYICVVVKQIIGTPQISFNENKPELKNFLN